MELDIYTYIYICTDIGKKDHLSWVLYLMKSRLRHKFYWKSIDGNMCYKQSIELPVTRDPLLITIYMIDPKERILVWKHRKDSFSQSCSTLIRQLHSDKGVSPKVVP